MKIGLDIDGVVADFSGTVVALYDNWFGETCPIVWDRWDAYDMSPHFPRWADCAAWCDKAGVWGSMPFIPGAAAGIDALASAGHDIKFLTARRGDVCLQQTNTWFDREIRARLGLGRKRLYAELSGKKSDIPCQLYVDDGPEELAALKRAGMSTVRFEQPWNVKRPATAVVKNWTDLVALIGSLEQ